VVGEALVVVVEVGKRKGSVITSLFLANGAQDRRMGGGVVIRDSLIANLLSLLFVFIIFNLTLELFGLL